MRRAIAIILLLLAPGAVLAAEKARPDTGKAAGGVFDHQKHLSNAPGCADCHQAGDLSIVPDPAKCDDCHDKGYAAKVSIPAPGTHGGFWYRDHKVLAR